MASCHSPCRRYAFRLTPSRTKPGSFGVDDGALVEAVARKLQTVVLELDEEEVLRQACGFVGDPPAAERGMHGEPLEPRDGIRLVFLRGSRTPRPVRRRPRSRIGRRCAARVGSARPRSSNASRSRRSGAGRGTGRRRRRRRARPANRRRPGRTPDRDHDGSDGAPRSAARPARRRRIDPPRVPSATPAKISMSPPIAARPIDSSRKIAPYGESDRRDEVGHERRVGGARARDDA